MEKFEISQVIKNLFHSLLYFLLGSLSGVVAGLLLFNINQSLYQAILTTWFNRLLFGVKFLNNQYTFWFILNNYMGLLLLVVSSVWLMIHIGKSRKSFTFLKFKFSERNHPKITLMSLYMIPIGALLINGFLISLFATYTYLNGGYEKFLQTLSILAPHGINELLALFLAASLGLTYVKILEPLILKKRWNEATRLGKKLIFSKTTLIVLVFISILIVFGAYIETLGIIRIQRFS